MDTMKTIKNLLKTKGFINGQWLEAKSGKTFAVFNPATNEKIAEVADMGAMETQNAIDSAHKAWLQWRTLTAQERSEYLLRWNQLIIEHKQALAMLATLECGKTLKEALTEVDYTSSFVQWFAEEAKRIYGDVLTSPSHDRRIVVIKQAIGVTAAITPWNFPLAMITRKCAPALAAGCTVILKPAEATPLSALALAELANQAEIPPGVINVVIGHDPRPISETLCKSPIVRKLSFTGSTEVGKLLMHQSSDTLKKLSLELGGNAPFIVFEDADIDAAVSGAIAAKFRNSGQTCVCANRFYIQDSIYDVFKNKIATAIQALKVGNGLDPDVTQGPLINQEGVQKIENLIADATKHNAKIIIGGKPHALGGNFYQPTLLTDINNKMQLVHEEIFGPVVALGRFKDEQEIIQLANDTSFGLASYFYSRDIGRIWRVAEALESGMVAVNTGIFSTVFSPFGGIKYSGMGREGSKYGIDEFIEIKSICIAGI